MSSDRQDRRSLWRRRLMHLGAALMLLGSVLYGALLGILVAATCGSELFGMFGFVVGLTGAIVLGLLCLAESERAWNAAGVLNGLLVLPTCLLTLPAFLLFVGSKLVLRDPEARWWRGTYQLGFG